MRYEANFNAIKWMPVEKKPFAKHQNGDSTDVFILLETGEILLGWYEHKTGEWVTSSELFPGFISNATHWMEPKGACDWISKNQTGEAL